MSTETSYNQDLTKDLAERISSLSPEKRALLELKLKKMGPAAVEQRTIPRRSNGQAGELSFSQQRLWFLQQVDPDSSVYNIVRAVRLSGKLNVEALRRTLDTILARHEVLRTTIGTVDGQPVQSVAPIRPIEMSKIDSNAASPSERDARVRLLLEQEIRRPFGLDVDLMLRATLLRFEEEEHVLVLATHHIASDGWSSRILWEEITAIYAAYCKGETCPFPELPIQYADFAIWQRQWLRGETLDRQVSYWKRQLKGAPTLLQLPTDRPRPPIETHRGSRQIMHLSRPLSEELKKLSQQEGVTLFMTLVAAFTVLLFRYSRQEDVVVGVPVANRSRPETEKLIGFFVNNLVMRVDLSGNPTFRELLGRVREVALGAYAHQDLPFEKLVEELQPERNLSHAPIFQVMFGFQSVGRGEIGMPGLAVTSIDFDVGTAKFDLFLSMVERQDSIRSSLEYNTDLFDDRTIVRFLNHFQTLLDSAATDPGRRISELPILAATEERQLTVDWNDTASEFPSTECVHHLFEAQASRTPDAVAAVCPSIRSEQNEDRKLTYRELNVRANQLAHYLRSLGVGPEVPVGICLERSLEMLVAVLAVLKAGGAYVPLDPSYPKERLRFVLQDSGMAVLLTERKLAGDFMDSGARLVCVDSEREVVARAAEENPTTNVGPENLAYAIYTSGSTGKPKGVQVAHRSVVNFLSSMRKRPGLTERDVLVAVTTLSFDIAGLELFLPLSVGARVVIADRQTASDGFELAQLLGASAATVMQATPASWRLLVDAGWQPDRPFEAICGGEALSQDLAGDLVNKVSSLWNVYGPTETTVWSTIHRVQAADRAVPIGGPIGNTRVYILDPYFHPVPVGVPGEVYIGGAGLARGYANRPELTAEKFVPDPFGETPGARLYRTGDSARYLPGGEIEFLGRLDDQVKIRGFRIELGEIESALSEHESVKRAIVTDKEIAGDRRLIAYVVHEDEGSPDIAELKDFLRAKLPDYMIPSAFVFLDAFPQTPNGKVDRRALPSPEGAELKGAEEYVAPRTDLERFIAEVWREVLGVDTVGIRDNFFDLGGHSLLSIKVVSRIEKKIGARVDPREMIYQTLGQFAAACEQRASTAEPDLLKRMRTRLLGAVKNALSRD